MADGTIDGMAYHSLPDRGPSMTYGDKLYRVILRGMRRCHNAWLGGRRRGPSKQPATSDQQRKRSLLSFIVNTTEHHYVVTTPGKYIILVVSS